MYDNERVRCMSGIDLLQCNYVSRITASKSRGVIQMDPGYQSEVSNTI